MTETQRPRILVATHNKGKRAEFAEFLAPLGIDVVSLADLGLPEPEETGTTFEENADIKSVAALAATGIPALADDSGICVDALDGRPGVYTADWAGEPRDYLAAMTRVERELGESGSTDRGARFVSVLSLALPDGSIHRFRGEVLGTLVWPPRGGMGFGFDPVFVPEGEERTFAEMRSEEKAGLSGEAGSGTGGLSHRARSFAMFAAEFLDGPEGRRILGLS